MGKNPKINSSTDWNKAETVGKISKINSSTGTLIQHRRVSSRFHTKSHIFENDMMHIFYLKVEC